VHELKTHFCSIFKTNQLSILKDYPILLNFFRFCGKIYFALDYINIIFSIFFSCKKVDSLLFLINI